jgi:hypothetical protein
MGEYKKMKVTMYSVPWIRPHLTKELSEAISIIGDNIWKEASIHYIAEREIKAKANKSQPKGMQRYLNEALVNRFRDNDWYSDSGYFFKNHTWIRITFRHQMSLGSDFLDALKVCKKEGMELAVILAADRETLNVISPNDAAAIISFEKLQNEVFSLNGAMDIPLVIGKLTQLTSASDDIRNELLKNRPRDTTVPTLN